MNMKTIMAALLTGLALIIAGCGGGGGGGASGGGGGGGNTITTATGKFVDAPVEGLQYVSGGQSGFTDANGDFTYEVGQTVKFTVGGVIIGQATGASTITPIDLVNAATSGTSANAATPAVVQIVQFLLTASSRTATGIKIDSAVTTACASQNINLSTANSTNFTTMINQVATAAGNRAIINANDAQNHFTASYNGLSSGTVVLPDPSITGGGALPPSITTQPTNSSILEASFGGGNTKFTVAAIGYNLSYQWQVDVGSGFTSISDSGVYTGSNTATLALTGVTNTMNGYKYRVIVSGLINSPVTSNSVTLSVVPPTKAVITLNIPTLPAGKQVAGVSFKIQIPAGVTPAVLSGIDASGSITLTGGATGGLSGASYDSTTNTITSGNISTTGFGAGDFLLINCLIKSNTTVTSSGFTLLEGSVIDSTSSSLGVTPTISVAFL